MEYLYVLISDKMDWENLILYNSSEDAIQGSIKNPELRVEIFNKTSTGYKPAYNYYKNGFKCSGDATSNIKVDIS
jgi:hypothetical protein